MEMKKKSYSINLNKKFQGYVTIFRKLQPKTIDKKIFFVYNLYRYKIFLKLCNPIIYKLDR